MTNQERDNVIMENLNQGMSLSDVQKLLESEYGIRMTYFELRMLAADLQVNWEKLDKPKAKPAPAPAPVAEEPAEEEPQPEPPEVSENDAEDDTVEESGEESGEESAPTGETAIVLDEPPMPGTAVSGAVTFVSGAKGKFAVTQDGRFGFEPDEGSEQPSQDDFMLFRVALRKKLTGEDEPEDPNAGPTTVELDAVMRPGVRLSGTVQFSSGSKARWMVDMRGQLDYELEDGAAEPTRRDLVKFQRELQNVLSKKGY